MHRGRDGRHVAEQKGANHGTRPQRHDQRGSSAGESEQHALGDELASEAEPGSPQCQTDRDLPLALQRTGDQEIGDVSTSDEQHDHRNGAEPQRDSGVLRHLGAARMLHRPKQGHCVGIPVRVHVLGTERERSLALAGFPTAGSEPPDDLEEVRPAVERAGAHQLGCGGGERHPGVHVFVVDAREPFRRYADHGVRATPELELSPEDAGVALEGRAPEAVTQHDHRGAARTVLVRQVEAPQRGPHAEQREMARRGEHQVHAAIVDAASQAGVLGVGERRERVEGRGGLPDQCVQGIARDARRRRAKRRKASAKVEADDALWGPYVRRRPEQQRVHHAEDRGVGADPEREADDRRGDERGAARERPEGVAEVGEQGVHHSRSATVGASLDARKAGIHVANALATPSPLMASAKDDASNGVNPYSNAAAYRSVTPASAAPMAMPLASSTPHSANIMRMTVRGSAPSAMRTPISIRRRVTRYDITPYSPIAAISMARTPKNPDSQAINRSVTSNLSM